MEQKLEFRTFNHKLCNHTQHRPNSLSFSKCRYILRVQNVVNITDLYNYLGVMVDEYVNYKTCLKNIVESITKGLDLYHNTFTILQIPCVLHVITFCGSITYAVVLKIHFGFRTAYNNAIRNVL